MDARAGFVDDLVWYLEGYNSPQQGLVRTPVRPLPFRIGRRAELELSLRAPSVSQEHAEIYRDGAGLWLRDLDSTNGTFLNRHRVSGATLLQEGDILHFADQEFRLVLASLPEGVAESGTMQLSRIELPQRLIGNTRDLRRLLDQEEILTTFQPIVRLSDGVTTAYEALCRGTLPGLPTQPADLLTLASSVGLERELSRAFRTHAAAAVRHLPEDCAVFFNTHPHEIADPQLLVASLQPLLPQLGPRRLVLEIHETAVTNLDAMRDLGETLRQMGIGLAYDDFGAGQARLLELVEAPPTHLKFDIRLIRDLDLASEGRREMMGSLVSMVRRLGVISVAEGVERPAEAAAVRTLGFDCAQGYHFGRPEPAG